MAALAVAVITLVVPSAADGATSPVAATGLGRSDAPMRMTPDADGGTAGSAIVPGAVGRTSMALVATYDVGLRLSYATGRISATSS